MAPLPPDPYKTLGVSKDAQTPEIRSSYRKLVLKCHPDKVQDPKLKEEKQNEFQRVQQAYELLTDDAERQKYDEKVKLEDLRRQMKEKAYVSSPKPSTKRSAEFDTRTPDMRSSFFKASPSPGKVYYTQVYDDDFGSRGARLFESKSRSSKRDGTFSERYSKRESEREKEKDRERDRRRKEEDAAARRKADKEALKAEKKRQEKLRDKEIKREAEEKQRQRYAKVSADSYEEELHKSDRKRSSKKHDDKGGRSSPRDEMPSLSSRPPMTSRLYSANDRGLFDRAATYVEASTRVPAGPGLYRSASYSTRPAYPPAAPSPPPTKKAFVSDDTDSDDNVRRSAAPSRRGSGDAPRPPRLSRERSSYHKKSSEVLEDHIPAGTSPAARHASKSAAYMTPKAGSPPRFDLPPRTNSMPQSGFSRPSPSINRAHTVGVSAEPMGPRGRDRSRMHAQAEASESEEDYERERRHRSRRTVSPEPMPSREHVSRYEVDSARRTRRVPYEDGGHAYYMHPHPIHVESRPSAGYREGSYSGMPPSSRYGAVKTSKYDDIRYSEPYGYREPVRA